MANDSGFDGSSVRLERGIVVGHARPADTNRWSLVVALPERPPLVIMPRAARRDLPTDQTGDPRFDKRYAVLGAPPRLEYLRAPLRAAWLADECDWYIAGRTLSITLQTLDSRKVLIKVLERGLDRAEALLASRDVSPATLLTAIEDRAWRVAGAALDALLRTPGEELDAAYRLIFAGRGAPRLRVHALQRANAWEELAREVDGSDTNARSDAFQHLVSRGPAELIAAAARVILPLTTGLDRERSVWLADQLLGDRRATAHVPQELAERWLLERVECSTGFGRACIAALERIGSGLTLRSHAGSSEPELQALCNHIRARLSKGSLSLVEAPASGGLSVADD